MSWANKTLHFIGSPNITDWTIHQLQDLSLSFSFLRTILISVALFVWFVLIVRLRKVSGSRNTKIPFVSHFFIPLPNFVRGLYTLYMLQKDGVIFTQKFVSKYGPFFQLPLGPETVYFVADANIAQKILSSSDPTHLNRPRQFYERLFMHEYRDGLLVLDYDVWSAHRKVIAQSFTYNSLQTYLHCMNKHGRNLTEKLLSLCTPETGNLVEGKEVDELIWSETIKIILETAMGSDCCTDEESAIVHDNFKRGKHIIQHRFQNPYLFLPPIWWLHPNRTKLNQNVFFLQNFFTKIIQKFRQSSSKLQITPNVQNSNELQDELLEMKPMQKCMIENMISAGASDKEVFAEIATLVTAGHETTALAITKLLFQLACNPECQSLCRDEILAVWGSDSANSPRMSDISELKYLERCIMESLRLTPTIPFFMRRLDTSFQIDGKEKLTLKKGKTVLFSPWDIHHDPTTYPDPDKFDPDRFLPENVQKRHPYAYMPFSGGPRNCIGFKFAILEMKVILAWLLHHFDISTNVDPRSVKYFMEVTSEPDRDLNIILKRR